MQLSVIIKDYEINIKEIITMHYEYIYAVLQTSIAGSGESNISSNLKQMLVVLLTVMYIVCVHCYVYV